MLNGHSAMAKRDFENATDIAATIDPSYSCFSEARKLLEEVGKNPNAMYKDKQQNIRQAQKSKERIAMVTITAVRDVATVYFQRQKKYLFFW